MKRSHTSARMGEVHYIGGEGLPDMTVVELAIIVALLRRGLPTAIEDLAPVLSQWFACPVNPAQLAGPIRRMAREGWLAEGPIGLMPDRGALEPMKLLYGGFIRMFGEELTDVVASAGEQLSLIDDHDKGNGHDRP